MHYTINSALLQLLSIKNLSCCWFTKRGRKKLIPIHQYSTYNTTGCCIGKRGFSNTPFTVYVKYIRVVQGGPNLFLSSQTDELMAATKLSDCLGLNHYKKAKKKIKHFIHLALAYWPQSLSSYHTISPTGNSGYQLKKHVLVM